MAAPLRQPQQARSLATHRRLLDAAVETLVARGLSGTSTPEVCRRAGTSQGALFKHFPSKTALLAATIEHLFARLVDDFRRGFAAIDEQEDRVAGAVHALAGVFADPRLGMVFELYAAARTDPELHGALAAVLARHRENLQREARALFPEASERPRFADAVDTVLDALQGAALGALVLPDPASEARRRERLIDFAHAELAAATA